MKEKLQFKVLAQNSEVKLLFYLSRILFRSQIYYVYPIYMFLQYCKIHQQKREYLLQTSDVGLINRLSDEFREFEIDENYTIIINNKFFRRKANAVLEVHYGEKSIRVNVKPLFSENISRGIILVMPTLMFNIKNNLLLVCSSNQEHSFRAFIRDFSPGKIGFADEITLALINSPCDLDNDFVDSIVKSYFQKPKIIRENDIIEICLKKNITDIPCNLSKIFNMKQSVYFKCTKVLDKDNYNINKGGSYVVLGETAVKQVANIQSFIPSRTKIKLFSNELQIKGESNIRLCPSGLENYAAAIEATIKPFFTKKLLINPVFLITGKKGSGKEELISSIASKFGMHFYRITSFDITAHVYAQNETKLRNIFFNAKLYAPCILYIKNFESFERNNEGQTDERIISHFTNGLKNLFENNKYPVLLFCSSNDDKISPRLKREFLEIFKINPPTKEERLKILEWWLKYYGLRYEDTTLTEVAQKTNTFLFKDLKVLVEQSRNYQLFSQEKLIAEENNLNVESFSYAIDYMHLQYNENIGAPKVPKVHWKDIGGLKDVKEEIIKTINFPLKHPEFSTSTGLRRLGILLFGPPGTGKTLLAKAVATECNLCFLSVKGPELLNMYIGQSEENIREVFERARAASPCIIFFDELDSLAPNRGVSGDSGGVMDRVVSQLLAEMDGLNEKATVFIIGATNRPDLIDPALLRPGRFDKLLYVGPATDDSSRLSVLKALTRKFNLDDEVELSDIVKRCPSNISGADFYGICAESWMHAVRRTIRECENDFKEVKNIKEKDVKVNIDDFLYALDTVKPSITPEDLKYFEKLKNEISSNV